jgi:FkbM family methyltransferase
MFLNRVHRVRGYTFLKQPLAPGAVVVDLGANRGDFAAEMVRKFGCTAYAVEAVQEIYEQIPQSPSLTAYHVAIGGTDGTARIFLYGGLGCSIRSDYVPELGDRQEIVEQVSLATLFDRAGIGLVDLMKVDIEGAEIEMFESASDDQLRAVAQLTVEFHDFLYPDLVAPVGAIKRRLCGLGFAEIKFTRNNADVLFVNRNRLSLSALEEAHLQWIVRYRERVRIRIRRHLLGKRDQNDDQ